ncbi:hypothetical protein E5288_WYG016653 [Bos mutus]|uniref:J domain-containing protein n=1 Tax=Bos mutus TaxID=72004 RepID=A0A6B0R6V6_9CETA|nr:hypothetical protein [Bos mutus]
MAAGVGVAPAGDGLRYSGSLQPPAQPSDADLDRGLDMEASGKQHINSHAVEMNACLWFKTSDFNIEQARSLIAVGLGIAALGFAGRYAFQIWKPLGQVITETAKKISTPSFSSYYKGGFEQKMSRREASLILGVSPSASKAKIRAAHRSIMILNHPDKAPGYHHFSKREKRESQNTSIFLVLLYDAGLIPGNLRSHLLKGLDEIHLSLDPSMLRPPRSPVTQVTM